MAAAGNNSDGGDDDDDGDDETEDGLHSTVVIVSTRDSFTLKQDICMCCGSFGKGSDGYLIGCVQCGQCFHAYCVSVKVSICNGCFFYDFGSKRMGYILSLDSIVMFS